MSPGPTDPIVPMRTTLLRSLVRWPAITVPANGAGTMGSQIAAHLDLSEKTVRNHITYIFDKIGVENRSQAIVLARERGLGQARRP